MNVAIPSMQADLGLDQADLQWVVTTYAVALGGFLLLGGRAADLLGRRRVLVGGLALFAAASLAAGLADSLAQLTAFVVVERRAASPLVPLGMFRQRTLTAATVVAVLVFDSFFATIF